MKLLKSISLVVTAIAITAVSYTGCRKADASKPGASALAVSVREEINDNFIAESSFDDAVSIINNSISNELSNQAETIDLPVNFQGNIVEPLQAPCARMILLNTHPYSAIIDFGNGCRHRDGNYRSGKIKVSWTNSIYNPGSEYRIEFENYFFNYNKIEGTVRVSDQGYNADNNLVFNVCANGSVTVFNNYLSENKTTTTRAASVTMTYSSFNTIEWSSGDIPGSRNYDVYFVCGTLILTVGTSRMAIDYSYMNNRKDDLASVTAGDVETFVHLNRNPMMIANIH